MFARHTNTRLAMKGSGVVQGLKSLADKIHPQLPLTTKESQRLLTALTSSFRKHLDQAHPNPNAGEVKHDTLGKGGVSKPQVQNLHSSASYHADRHLASVLTNPLLAKDAERLNITSAKADLAQNPSQDPMKLLEHYHEKHAATIPIAQLCLEHCMSEIKGMSAERKKQYLQDCEPGRRVFHWLRQSGQDDTPEYVDNLRFVNLMVYFLHLEGLEEKIWEWLKLDVQLAGDAKPRVPITSKHKAMLHRYRWRARLLRALMEVKLRRLDHPTGFLDAVDIHNALDSFVRACDLKSSVKHGHHLLFTPLAHAGSAVSREVKYKLTTRKDLDPRRVDRFISDLPFWQENAPEIFTTMDRAVLCLTHPTKSSPDPALSALRELFDEPISEDASKFLLRIRNPFQAKDNQRWYFFMCKVIAMLRAESRLHDAEWVEAIVKKEFPPDLVRKLQANINKFEPGSRKEKSETVKEEPSRILMPTFA